MHKTAFFCKNGNWLGYVFDLGAQLGESVRSKKSANTGGEGGLVFYPTIGLQTSGESVKVNFGQDGFKFDILSFMRVSSILLSHSLSRQVY